MTNNRESIDETPCNFAGRASAGTETDLELTFKSVRKMEADQHAESNVISISMLGNIRETGAIGTQNH